MNKELFTLLTPEFKDKCQLWLQYLGAGRCIRHLNLSDDDQRHCNKICVSSSSPTNYYKFIKEDDADAIIFCCFLRIVVSHFDPEVTSVEFFYFQSQWASLYSNALTALVRSPSYKDVALFGKKMKCLYDHYRHRYIRIDSAGKEYSKWSFNSAEQFDLDLQCQLFRYGYDPNVFVDFLDKVEKLPWSMQYVTKLQTDISPFRKICVSAKRLPVVNRKLFWISSITRGAWINLYLDGTLQAECYTEGFNRELFPTTTLIHPMLTAESLAPIVCNTSKNDPNYARNLIAFSKKWYSKEILEEVYSSFHYHPCLIALFMYQDTGNLSSLILDLLKSLGPIPLTDNIVEGLTLTCIPEGFIKVTPFSSLARNLVDVNFNLRCLFVHKNKLKIKPYNELYDWIIDHDGREKAIEKDDNLNSLYYYYCDNNDLGTSWLTYTPRLSFGDIEPFLIAAVSQLRQSHHDISTISQYFNCSPNASFEPEIEIEVSNKLAFVKFKDPVPEWTEKLMQKVEYAREMEKANKDSNRIYSY